MRGWHNAITMNLWKNGYDCRETLLRSSNVENDDEKHPHEFLRHSGTMKNRKVESTMKIILKRSWRRNMTDDNSFLRQTLQ